MRNEIRFLLNGRPQRVSSISGDMTLLNWLRENPKLCGTKEGCSEGDCGACTVAISRPNSFNEIIFQPANACIMFLPMVDGASVYTVEGLKSKDGSLHPVQAALVENDGSQCGFCTPGFVMSLFVAWQNRTGLETETINRTLAGNLCRCTGYRTIVSAAKELHKLQVMNTNSIKTDDHTMRVESDDLCIENSGVRFLAPSSEASFISTYAKNPDAVIVGGATDVGLWVTKQHRDLGTIIWTGGVPSFKNMVIEGDYLRIGPAVTHQEFLLHIKNDFPEFARLIQRFAALQIRSTGTVCGNIANASPIGDLAPVFVALDGKIELNCKGEKRIIKLEDFFIDYGQQDRAQSEFISAILFPWQPAPNLRCYKISKRFDQDISAVMLAANLVVHEQHITSVKLAFGGMAGTTKRAKVAEETLLNQPFTIDSFTASANALVEDFEPLSDLRGSSEYRMKTAQNLIFKYGLEILGSDHMDISDTRIIDFVEN